MPRGNTAAHDGDWHNTRRRRAAQASDAQRAGWPPTASSSPSRKGEFRLVGKEEAWESPRGAAGRSAGDRHERMPSM